MVFLIVLLYYSTFNTTFIWDDRTLIVNNTYIRSLKNIPFFFTLEYWKEHHLGGKTYRPLRTTTFALDYHFWKFDQRGYHLTNLTFYILNCLLVYFLVLELEKAAGRGESSTGYRGVLLGVPLAAALLFAVHPIHTETIVYIKNRSEMITMLFYQLSFLLFLKHLVARQLSAGTIAFLASLVCFILSLISKETAFSLPPMLVLFVLLFTPRDRWRKLLLRTAPYFVLALLYLVFKKTGMGAVAMYEDSFQSGPYYQLLSVFITFGRYFKLLVFPVNLVVEHEFVVPGSFFRLNVLLSVLSLVLLTGAVQFTVKRLPMISFALIWIFMCILPVSNIIFIGGRPFAEQRLYLPSLGFCLLLAVLFRLAAQAPDRARLAAICRATAVPVLLVLLVLYSYGTYRRNLEWRDPLTLWKSAARISPNSARVFNQLGSAYGRAGEKEKAIEALRRAVKLGPPMVGVYYNLGLELSSLGRSEEAMVVHQEMIDKFPDCIYGYFCLGVEYAKLGRYEDAIRMHQKVLELDPGYAEGLSALGNVYDLMGDTEKAIDFYRQAIEVSPTTPNLYFVLGGKYAALGMAEESLALHHKLVENIPDSEYGYFCLGMDYAGMGRLEEAVSNYEKALELSPRLSEGYFNLGLMFYRMDRNEKAILSFKKALEIDSSLFGVYRYLSWCHYKLDRFGLAVDYFDLANVHGFHDRELGRLLESHR